jgi:Predicted tRNA(5-methylaminomethyl-2-thiouridylate) methyltransferase, contains the PP-loop ATPase domain
VLGRHRGVADFTVGQRRGLGVALGAPRYVVEVRARDRTVVVGTRDELRVAGCDLEDVTFVAGRPPADPAVAVRIRYRSRPVPARLLPGPDGWRLRFATPQEAVVPGQAAVFSRGEEVLGGGTIAGVHR